MKNIDKRLQAILNEIQGHTLIDVGCDHGKVACQALLDKRVEKVVAVDISDKSLQKCRDLAKKLNLNNIDFRCSDGLKAVEDYELDCVVIAGIGGYEIVKILKESNSPINKLILCPHQDVEMLRDYLKDKYFFEKDYCIHQDDHFYSLIVLKEGVTSLTKKEINFGKDTLENQDYDEYLKFSKDKYEKILTNNVPEDRRQECEEILEIIEDELNGSKENI